MGVFYSVQKFMWGIDLFTIFLPYYRQSMNYEDHFTVFIGKQTRKCKAGISAKIF